MKLVSIAELGDLKQRVASALKNRIKATSVATVHTSQYSTNGTVSPFNLHLVHRLQAGLPGSGDVLQGQGTAPWDHPLDAGAPLIC